MYAFIYPRCEQHCSICFCEWYNKFILFIYFFLNLDGSSLFCLFPLMVVDRNLDSGDVWWGAFWRLLFMTSYWPVTLTYFHIPISGRLQLLMMQLNSNRSSKIDQLCTKKLVSNQRFVQYKKVCYFNNICLHIQSSFITSKKLMHLYFYALINNT